MINKYCLLFTFLLSLCTNPKDNSADNGDALLSTTQETPEKQVSENMANKWNGLSFESPPRIFPQENFKTIENLGANAIGLIPFGFSYPTGEKVHYNSDRQWWGERPEGITTLCDYANAYELQVMIKPQVWIPGSWVGEFDLKTEEDFAKWQETYTEFILDFARIAQEKEAALFCVGTEYKKLGVKYPDYWRGLIKKVRAIYDGPLTYASNWDHYQNIPFWEDLDFIGVNAYFPLVNKATPSVTELKKAWKKPKEEMKAFAQKKGKSILFTEYGYMSCDYAAWKTWENEKKNPPVNLTAQANAYQAVFESFQDEDWWAGGFLWEWQSNSEEAGGPNDKHYSPQRKPAEKVIQAFFTGNGE